MIQVIFNNNPLKTEETVGKTKALLGRKNTSMDISIRKELVVKE